MAIQKKKKKKKKFFFNGSEYGLLDVPGFCPPTKG
jgi:hypothetical protein